jgi:alcohol dehydrogenase (NADP+)
MSLSDIPRIGLGTFGSDTYSANQVAEAVYDAAIIGYRHFDCAAVYGNEAEVGDALGRAMRDGIPREELWITSKLWNDKHAEADVVPAFEKTLSDLKLEYLNLYLIHWPFPNWHPPGCDVTARSPDSKPYIHEAYMRTWRQLEDLVHRGLVRHIGTSNMTIPKLKLLLRDADIKPHANQMELHPHFQQPDLFEFVKSHGILPIGYSPLGSPSRPERDRTTEDSVDLEDPDLVAISKRHGVSPATISLRWAIQRGQIPIPFSVKRAQYEAALRTLAGPNLSDQEMAQIAQIDRDCRLIKGQVFLWKEDQTWEDLWDLDGQIAQ